MERETKREIKKKSKLVMIFLAIAFPLFVILIGLLYVLIPSLVNNRWVVIILVVVLGIFIWFLVQYIANKKEEKKKNQPKKHDPYAD